MKIEIEGDYLIVGVLIISIAFVIVTAITKATTYNLAALEHPAKVEVTK